MTHVLMSQVVEQPGVVMRGYAECGVPSLPVESIPMAKGAPDPAGAAALHGFHDWGKCQSGWQLEIEMNVVTARASRHQPSTDGCGENVHSGEQATSPFRVEPRPALSRSPDQVNPQLCIHAWHGGS